MLTTVIYAPYIVVELLVTGGRPADTPSDLTAVMVLSLLGWVIGSLAEAAVVVAVSNSYLNADPDVQGSLRSTLRRFVPVLFAVLLKWLFIGMGAMVGFFVAALVAGIAGLAGVMSGTMQTEGTGAVMVGALLLVGALVLGGGLGIYLFARYFAVPATVMLEGLGVLAGMRRSRDLSQGIKRKVLGALGLPMLLYFMFQFIVVALMGSLPGPAILSFVLQKAIILVATPILYVIATLLYYDARIRKEGFDIEVMAAELASTKVA
jgi:hypothetical protein